MATRKTLPFSELVDAFPALKRLGRARARTRIPVVRQMTEGECGAACLAMVLAFFGKVVRLDDLRGNRGTQFYDVPSSVDITSGPWTVLGHARLGAWRDRAVDDGARTRDRGRGGNDNG